jgi:L-alanine-DL-glutamate epimerase-like enolase superfamily enzyme
MQIQDIQSTALAIPMKFTFSQSNNTTQTSSAMIIRISSQAGAVGYGECCPRLYVTGESLDTVKQDIEKIRPLLLSRTFDNMFDIRHFATHELPAKIGLSSICGIELALMDAWSKTHQQSLIDAIGGNRETVTHYTGILPQGSPKVLAIALQQLSFFKFKELKVKVNANLQQSLETIRLIRSDFFPDINIRVDANTAWSYEDAVEQIPALLDQGVDTFEQIFPKDKLGDLQKITAAFGDHAKIMADESLTSYASAQHLIEHKICNHFNLKLSKNGGFWNALRLYDLIQDNDLSCQLGAHFGETSILTATGLLLASKAPQLTAIEGGYGDYLLEKDIISNPIKFNRNAQIKLKEILPDVGLIPNPILTL